MEALSSLRFPSGDGFDLVVSGLGLGARAGDAALPVLLLHGLSQQRAFWEPVMRRMRTRPVAALDQRGHGDSDSSIDVDYSVPACARDAALALDALGWPRAVVVGHSWGASVAVALGAAHPDRVAAIGLVDGGLWSPTSLGTREEARARLTPPALGMPEADLWAMIRSDDSPITWTAELESALRPTFVVDEEGRIRTRLGFDRHMRVLDGLLDYSALPDLAAVAAAGRPVRAVLCEGVDRSWSEARRAALAETVAAGNVEVHSWAGAVHDVPLQWPERVAGFADGLAEAAVQSEIGKGGDR